VGSAPAVPPNPQGSGQARRPPLPPRRGGGPVVVVESRPTGGGRRAVRRAKGSSGGRGTIGREEVAGEHRRAAARAPRVLHAQRQSAGERSLVVLIESGRRWKSARPVRRGGVETPAARPALAPRRRPLRGEGPDRVPADARILSAAVARGRCGVCGRRAKAGGDRAAWAGIARGPEGVARLGLGRCVRRCAPGGSSQAVGRVPMASTSGSCGPSHVRMRSVLLTETTPPEHLGDRASVGFGRNGRPEVLT
jgi:hypothetical protein